jgi:type IV pilus assembly protein PilE
MKAAQGFSLIELLIVVVIIGILAAVAIPSYQNSVTKGHRSAAQGFLLTVAQREQQYFQDSRAYVSVADNASFPGSALKITASTDVTAFYDCSTTVTAVAGQPPTFSAQCVPKAGTKQQNDGTLTINETGTKTPSDKW